MIATSSTKKFFAKKRRVAAGLVMVFVATFIAMPFSSVHAEEAAAPIETVIHAGHLIAVPGEAAQENVSVIIEGGVIKSITEGFVRERT